MRKPRRPVAMTMWRMRGMMGGEAYGERGRGGSVGLQGTGMLVPARRTNMEVGEMVFEAGES